MKDSVFEGFGGEPTPRTERGELLVEPSGVGGEVASSGSYLMDTQGYEVAETDEGMWGRGGNEPVSQGRPNQGRPVAEEDGSGFFLQSSGGVGGGVGSGNFQGGY